MFYMAYTNFTSERVAVLTKKKNNDSKQLVLYEGISNRLHLRGLYASSGTIL